MSRSVLVLAAALIAAVGCNNNRKPILSGMITLDGKALENATLQIIPVAGDGQTAGVVVDKDGRYKVPVSPTKLRVVVSASRKIGERKMYDTPDSPVQDIFEEVVPAKYSDMNKSELTVTVEQGKDTEYNIDLKSEPKKK